MSIRTTVTLVALSTLTALAAISPQANASAASPSAPAVKTGAASGVSYTGAVLSGTVDPHGASTTYYFQYGPTRAYGLQSAAGLAGSGTAAVRVSVPIAGLGPATRYHFRLVALNASGAGVGSDGSFKTAAIPLSLQILAAPNPTPFGSPAVIQGTLSGTGNANRAVFLQQNPFPYTQGFVNVGEPHLTTATGGFAFPVLGLTQATQYRVVTVAAPQIVSPIVIEQVAPTVTIRVRHTRRRHHVRIFGTITPNEEGMAVEVLRLGPAGPRRVGLTFARQLNASSAHYSKVVRVHRGAVYEVFVRVTNGAQTSAYSAPVRIR
jgi:hypothetical protein